MCIQSNFDVLKFSTPSRPELVKRLAQLEHTAKMLREYHVKACKSKKTKVITLAAIYEELAEIIRTKIESKTLIN